MLTHPTSIAVGHGPLALSVRLWKRGAVEVDTSVQSRRLNAAEEPQLCKAANSAERICVRSRRVSGAFRGLIFRGGVASSAKGAKACYRFTVRDKLATQQYVGVAHKRASRSITARKNHIAVTSYACS